ncbi:MAG: CHASE3 domain-containing protein [Candidatus Obscuribacterales bacterium]|nr:CHASE3 domain-containing protein [Candidatus Obscuribacterales bacterium]
MIKRGLKLSDKALILVIIPLAFQFLFVGTLVLLLRNAEYETRRESHHKAIVTESYSILNAYVNQAMSLYFYWITKQEAFKEHYEEVVESMPVQINSLKILLRDKPQQTEALDRILRIGNQTATILDRADTLVEESKQSRSPALKSELNASIAELENCTVRILREMRQFVRDQESGRNHDPRLEEQSRWWILLCLFLGLAINVIIAISLAVYFNRGTTRRLYTMVENTRHLAEGEPLEKPISGNDEIAQLDSTFHEMADALEQARQYRQELISIVSHELRTPLTSVKATMTRLSMDHLGPLPEQAKTAVSKAENNIDRLIKLINDLLDIERMESGKLDIYQRPVALSSILGKSMDAVLPFAEKNQIDLDIAATNLSASADEDRLIQVIVNLLSNAIKFSPPESTVRITVEPMGNQAEIAVIDQGKGIPDEFKDKIFQRYAQVSKEDGKKGTGLGLPICKAIIEGHGGTIGVKSELGAGSTFWIRIPLA